MTGVQTCALPISLLLLPRETPFSTIHLENLLKLSQCGVRIIPAMPAFYQKPESLDDLVNFVVGKLLEQDLSFLDRIQVQMATAREFLILIRLRDEKEKEVFPYLSRIEKSLKEQGFSVKRADKEDIKRILAVYFEQNVTTEKFEDFDGERWVIFNE